MSWLKMSWLKRLVCVLVGHSPNSERGKFRCVRCGCQMEYRDTVWTEVTQ